jgi:hypothetical protein
MRSGVATFIDSDARNRAKIGRILARGVGRRTARGSSVVGNWRSRGPGAGDRRLTPSDLVVGASAAVRNWCRRTHHEGASLAHALDLLARSVAPPV